MATKRFPGLAKDWMDQQRRGAAGSPNEAMPARCPVCYEPIEGNRCLLCGFDLGEACRVCGCTETTPCYGAFGGACSWIKEPTGTSPGLCNAHESRTTTMLS